MNTTHPAIERPLALALGILLATAALPAAEPPPPSPDDAPPGSPMLFMGLDLVVQRDGVALPVRGIERDHLVVASGDRTILIPTTEDKTQLKIERSLKLAAESATVVDLASERAYTTKNDPYRKFANQAGAAGAAGTGTDMATGGLVGADIAVAFATMSANAGAPGAAAALELAKANQAEAYDAVGSAAGDYNSSINHTGTYVEKLYEELDKKLFDALEVSFQVSSPKPLDAPYVVVITEFREKDAGPGLYRNMITARTIEPIDATPRKVRFLQGGFPPGYEISEVRVHLFNRGTEIATNIAPMRVVLTPDEAFQYAVVDYVSANKDATLPAAPAPGQVTDELRSHLLAKYPDRPVYVRVLLTGRAGQVFADKDCSKPLGDRELDALLHGVRFNPALARGKAVNGVAMLVASTPRP